MKLIYIYIHAYRVRDVVELLGDGSQLHVHLEILICIRYAINTYTIYNILIYIYTI